MGFRLRDLWRLKKKKVDRFKINYRGRQGSVKLGVRSRKRTASRVTLESALSGSWIGSVS